MWCCWVPACGAQRQDKGIILLHCENAVFIVKIRLGIKGACMNHKYLHAINVWTKDLEWLRWENFFSHEKQCFILQDIFNFVSAIANLKSQRPLRITLSRPKNFMRRRSEGKGWWSLPGKNSSVWINKKAGSHCCYQLTELPPPPLPR